MTSRLEAIRTAVRSAAAAAPAGMIDGVVLIGSYARGEECANSDIDLVVRVRWPPTGEDMAYSSLGDLFTRHLQQASIEGRADVWTMYPSPQSKWSPIERRIRTLDVPFGCILLFGIDLCSELAQLVPSRPEVLRYLRDQLDAELFSPPYEPRQILLAALAVHYAQTGTWTTKHQLATASSSSIAREAWALRCVDGSETDVSHLDQAACAQFLRGTREAVNGRSKVAADGPFQVNAGGQSKAHA